MLLQAGDVITLTGDLGSGKTCFVRGLVKALSLEQGSLVSSPTYAILNEYRGEPDVYHMDCYRLKGADDAAELGLVELFNSNGISLVEWPEKISGAVPDDHLNLFFEYCSEDVRQITFTPHGNRFITIIEKIETAL